MTVSKEWIHLRSFLRQTYNDEVRKHFKDLPANIDPDNSTGRASAMRSCLITPNDSLMLMNIKVLNFRFAVQQVHLRPTVYGIPTETYQESVEFKLAVKLFFSQDAASVPDKRYPVEAEISFRLDNETYKTWTPAKSQTLANQIRTELAANGGYRWSKGKHLAIYRDPEHGYNLHIYALSETEGEEVVKKILSIRNHAFESDKFSCSTPKRNSNNNPTGTELIYGKSRKKRRWRPNATVRFRWASIQIWGVEEDVILVDKTGYYRKALISL